MAATNQCLTGVEDALRLADIRLGNGGPVLAHQEVGQQEDQRSQAHHDQADGNKARLGGSSTASVVGDRHQAGKGGQVVATGHQSHLPGAQPKPSLNCGDGHIYQSVHQQT